MASSLPDTDLFYIHERIHVCVCVWISGVLPNPLHGHGIPTVTVTATDQYIYLFRQKVRGLIPPRGRDTNDGAAVPVKLSLRDAMVTNVMAPVTVTGAYFRYPLRLGWATKLIASGSLKMNMETVLTPDSVTTHAVIQVSQKRSFTVGLIVTCKRKASTHACKRVA
jgi:hypothetical protein